MTEQAPLIRQRRTPPEGVGPMMRAARVRSGLGLRQTARAAGISHSMLFALESGTCCPSRVVADAVAAVLGLDETERDILDAAVVLDAGRSHPARKRLN